MQELSQRGARMHHFSALREIVNLVALHLESKKPVELKRLCFHATMDYEPVTDIVDLLSESGSILDAFFPSLAFFFSFSVLLVLLSETREE